MPIFLKGETKLLYVHVPKTGGTFVEAYFKRNGFDILMLQKPTDSLIPFRKCSPQHFHESMLTAVLDMAVFSYTFMTVRHPLHRLMSEYRMRTKTGIWNAQGFDRFIKEGLEKYAINSHVYDNHLRPQVQFWVEGAHVFKQEDAYDIHWADKMEKGIGLELRRDILNGERANATTGGKIFEPLKSTRLEIEKFYSQDFTKFDYDGI